MTSESGAKLRLKKDRQIRFVLEQGQLFRGRHVLLRALQISKIFPPHEGQGPLLAVVISKKKEKKAVIRNRMKRQLREIFRLKQAEISSENAYVLVARKVDKKTSYHDLEKDFLELLQKSNAEQKREKK